jgi:hydrophobe/amphiphile efflux-1 (HAE1) family protein
MFTHFFVKKPVFASVCSLLIILIGWIGYTRLPIQEYPTIEPPIVNVQTVYRGANPQVVETEVTELLEAEINGIEGVKSLTSSSREEQSSITVEFELNQDLDVAAQAVQNRVSRVIGRLPDEIDSPVVSKSNGGGGRIMWIAIFGENYSNLEISNYADKFIKNALLTVDGVSNIFIAGERRYAMRLWLNPKQMAARNITALDVEQALRRQNVEIPSGRIEGKMNEYPIRTLGRLQTPEEYEDLVIRRDENTAQIRLKEVGYAEIGAESDRTITRFNGQPAISLGISKTSGANLLEVADAVKIKIAELSKNFPEGMAYTIAVDDSDFVQLAIDEVWHSLFLAIAFVILVIFLFLRSWRATLIPALTIPVSLIGAFGIMYILGFSINILTLFALTLSTGLVVDDTIVVLENIVRYIEEKKMKPFPAVLNAVGEVVFAVIATTIVLIAVFIPVGFSGGTTGRLFNEFAITIAAAVVLSSFVALTLAPTVSARILQSKSSTQTRKNPLQKLVEIPLDLFEWGLKILQNAYSNSLTIVMDFKLIVVLSFILSLGLTAWFFVQIPQGFLPSEDRGRVFIPIVAPQGVSLEYTNNVVQEVEEILGNVPEMRTYFTIAGLGRGASQVNRGFAFTRLFPWSERTEPEQSQQNIVRQLFGRFSQITDALVFAINPSSLPGNSQGQAIQFVIQGNDLNELAEVAEAFKIEAEKLPEVVNLDTDLQINKPELVLEVNRLQAANLGVSVQEIARTLQILMGGQRITNFNQGNQQYEVIVQAEDIYRSNPNNIEAIYVKSDSGEMISLSSLVEVNLSTTPPQINHYNRFRSAQLEGSPAPGVSLGDALTALQNLADEILPQNMQTALAGESLEFAEAGQATLFIFALALAFIFLTLAAQFESYIDPFIILLAVPLSLLGAFGALWIAQLDLNIYSRIGLIMLIGLATKNSILIVEFANQLQRQGFSVTTAAIEAGKVRFRPILMTAFSTIFGVFPLAFATGAGAGSRISIGMTVLGGMLVSTILSLYVVPVFYAIAKLFQSRLFKQSHQVITDSKNTQNSNGKPIKMK